MSAIEPGEDQKIKTSVILLLIFNKHITYNSFDL